MSIPSNPPPQPPSNVPPQGPQSPSGEPTSYVDPTGAWAKFLSAGGIQATPQDVQTFMQGILKMFNIVIQQQQQAAQRANDQLKKSIEGDD